jgi:hypothetical protein
VQPILSGSGSTIAGRQAWTGNSGYFVSTTVNLPAAAAGKSIRLRWRSTSDESVMVEGWYVDNLEITDGFTCQRCLAAPVLVMPVLTHGLFVVSFSSVTGQTYYVETSSDLGGPAWSAIQTNNGNGSLLRYTNSNPSLSPQRFYRVRTE